MVVQAHLKDGGGELTRENVRLMGGAVAALLINGGSSTYHATITLAELNVTAAAVNVTDVWSGAPHGDVCAFPGCR